MGILEWKLIVCASVLSIAGARRPNTGNAVSQVLLGQSAPILGPHSVSHRRRLQQAEGESAVSGCKWNGASAGCIADGFFFESRGAYRPMGDGLEMLNLCTSSTEAPSDWRCSEDALRELNCRDVVLPREAACVPANSTYTQAEADALAQVRQDYRSEAVFMEECPLAATLERGAARNTSIATDPNAESCDAGWEAFVTIVQCTQCEADGVFFRDALTTICAEFSSEAACGSPEATAAVDAAICAHLGPAHCSLPALPFVDAGTPIPPAASGVIVPSDAGDSQTPETARSPNSAAHEEDDPPLSTAAIIGIAAAVVSIAVLIAVAAAAYIIRGPRRRGTKKPVAMHPIAANAPGSEGVPPPAGIYMPPPPGHAGGPPAGPPTGPPTGAPAMGRPPQLFIPPDIFPSARQFMASGAPKPHTSGGGAAHPPPTPTMAAAAGWPSQMGAQQLRRTSTEVGCLPARDVMVQQTRRLGGGDAVTQDTEFSILTRAAWDCTVAGSTPPPHIVPDNAQLPEEVLEAQIDHLLNQGQGEILPDLRLAPMLPQRIGQRGAVIFVRQRDDPSQLCAVKFFFEWADFEREAAATRNPDLAAAMPPVKAVHGNPEARSTAHLPPPLCAYPLPPALVTSKGESLDEHTARTSPDFVTSLSIMIHVTTVVGRLHDAGWVHRDLKPTNAVFLAQQARWALVDFGCAARRGDFADISFSLYYAPPEVIQAYKAGQDQIIATEAADVWALGVIAWELFTKRKFYGPAPDFKWVVKVLTGEEPLPSEVPLLPEVKERLGNSRFRNVFLSMLSRDPTQRPSVSQLLTSWNSVFSQTTSL